MLNLCHDALLYATRDQYFKKKGDNDDFVSVNIIIIFYDLGWKEQRNPLIRLCEVANKRCVPSLETDR